MYVYMNSKDGDWKGVYKTGLKNIFFVSHYGHFTESGYGHVDRRLLYCRILHYRVMDLAWSSLTDKYEISSMGKRAKNVRGFR